MKVKMNLYRIILTILLVIIMSIIFGFSKQNAIQSDGLSKKIAIKILNTSSKYKNMNNIEKNKILNRTNAIVRKIAHFSVYSVLGIVLMALATTTKIKNKWKVAITALCGGIYAISDEFHQNYSPGRTPKITDVYIDVLGVILGALIVMLVLKLVYEVRKE